MGLTLCIAVRVGDKTGSRIESCFSSMKLNSVAPISSVEVWEVPEKSSFVLIYPFSPEVVSVKTQTPACAEGCTLLPRNIPLPTGPNQDANEWGWGCGNKGNTMCEDTGVREHVCSGESKLSKELTQRVCSWERLHWKGRQGRTHKKPCMNAKEVGIYFGLYFR